MANIFERAFQGIKDFFGNLTTTPYVSEYEPANQNGWMNDVNPGGGVDRLLTKGIAANVQAGNDLSQQAQDYIITMSSEPNSYFNTAYNGSGNSYYMPYSGSGNSYYTPYYSGASETNGSWRYKGADVGNNYFDYYGAYPDFMADSSKSTSKTLTYKKQ